MKNIWHNSQRFGARLPSLWILTTSENPSTCQCVFARWHHQRQPAQWTTRLISAPGCTGWMIFEFYRFRCPTNSVSNLSAFPQHCGYFCKTDTERHVNMFLPNHYFALGYVFLLRYRSHLQPPLPLPLSGSVCDDKHCDVSTFLSRNLIRVSGYPVIRILCGRTSWCAGPNSSGGHLWQWRAFSQGEPQNRQNYKPAKL